METPSTCRYSRDHEWARREGDLVVIGITDYAQRELGDVVYVELPTVGTALIQGEPFGVVESTKSVSDLYAPVAGEVVAINAALLDAPEQVNSSPYDEGWMIKIRSDADLSTMLDATAYRDLVGPGD